jgi:thymus-specific serine protease
MFERLLIVCATYFAILAKASRFNTFRSFAAQEKAWHLRGHHNTENNIANAKFGTNSTTHFFTAAIVDHFGSWKPSHERWSQRFYVDDSLWGGDNFPIFLYIGGEGPQGPISDRLYMKTLAKEHQALVVALEHRFYGESWPTPDQSVESLQVLSSEQALADLARFVEHITRDISVGVPDPNSSPPLTLNFSTKGSKTVVFGGSYPGSLSAWFHLKYPHLSVGSVASSAPVFAEYNFEQYAQVVGYSLGYPLIGGSEECVSALEESANELHALANSTEPKANSSDIPEFLRPCGEIEGPLDFAQYLSTVFGNFQGAVQYNVPGSSPQTVAKICTTMLDVGPKKQWPRAIDRLANTMALFVNASAPFAQRCIQSSFEKDLVGLVKNTSFSPKGCDLTCNSTRQWIWQSCREFGFFQTTTGRGQPFKAFAEITVANVGKTLCEQAFPGAWGGQPYTGPRIEWSNTHYGNRDIASVNTTLPNGSADPWHSLGVVNSTDPFYNSCDGNACEKQRLKASDHLVFLDGTSHCRDMFAPVGPNATVKDPEAVVWAHVQIAKYVASYLM